MIWALLIVAVIVVLLVVGQILGRTRRGSVKIDATHEGAVSEQVFLVLPGILARGEEQINPLLATMLAHGDVRVYSYTGHRFAPTVVADEVARQVTHLVHENEQEVVLVGLSLGGMLNTLVVDRLDPSTLQHVRLIVVDSPWDADTLKPLPALAQPVFRLLRTAPLPNGFGGNRILKLMSVPPKDINITVPGDEDIPVVTGRPMTRGQYMQWVKDEARRGLSGHLFSMWWSQTSWMARAQLPTEKLRFLRSRTYVGCMQSRNDTVVQPDAADTWVQQTRTELLWVDSTHCGFLERYPEWSRFFGRLLAD